MEISTLQNYILGGLVCTRTLTAKDTSNTHWLFCIADAQIVLTKCMFLTIEGNKLSSFWLGTNYNLMTGYHVSIKTVQWLTVCHHDIVGNIHNIVDWAQADDIQLILQPLWTFLYFTICDTYTCITLAGVSILNLYVNRKILVIYDKLIARRTMKTGLITILLQPSIKVAGNTPVTQCISTVGSDINLNQPIALKMIILSSRLTYWSILRENNNTSVVCTHTNLILSTNHTKALHSTEFASLDSKTLVTIVKYTT